MTTSRADIVIVDDKRENLHLLSELLSHAGYRVRPIPNGDLALRAIRKSPPDLVLLDIMMPKVDGYEVCKELKAETLTREIPIIFISGLSDTFDRVKAFTSGGADYITKPFHKEEVLARIENQLTIQRQQRLLTSVLESSLDGIAALQCIRNNEGKVIDFQFLVANTTAARMVNSLPSDIVGKQLLEKFPQLKQEKLFSECLAVVEEGITIDREIYHESTRGWYHITIVKLDDGIALTLRDITNRKNIELALERQASIDGLTGVANRRHFDNYLRKEWQQSMNKTFLSLVLCDVDYFKLYNDHYGHQMGDKCLIQVARTIQQVAKRPQDLVARYGGEEFATILPATNKEGAWRVAEAIRKAILQLQFTHEYSKAHEYVTVSIGVSTAIPTPGSSLEQLVEAADRALYKAKDSGRNQVNKHEFSL